MANSGTAGYFGGGVYGVTKLDTVNKYAFSNDSRTTLGTGLSAVTQMLGAMANSGTAGYFGGGTVTAVGPVDTVDKFAFSDDGRTTLGTGLSLAREFLAGMANAGSL